jgi:GT2 family glycosyltransferase
VSDPEGDAHGKPKPLLTVSIVTYQGAAWMPGCLGSLSAQEAVDFEVIVHDNASSDGTLDLVEAWARMEREKRGRHVRVEAMATNLGFAAAHDRGIAAARGDVVVLLNQDVELDPGFLKAVVVAFERDPRIASVQPRLRKLRGPGERLEVLDTTGLVMGRDRRVISRAQGQPDGAAHADPGPVWGVDGPAPAYRRAALWEARLPNGRGGWEVLDEDFFLYKEDVDLAWRLRLLGWTAWYEPAALGWHARGTGGTGATRLLDIARTNRSISFQAKVLSWRNQRLMQIKNEDLVGYLVDLPWIARRELLSLAFIVLADPRRLRAIVDLCRAAPAAMRKRRYLRRLVAQAHLRRLVAQEPTRRPSAS